MHMSALRSMAMPRVALVSAALVAGLLVASIDAGPAQATPNRARDCTGCHGSGSVSGIVTARPSTTRLAPGARYTVAIRPPANRNGGEVGFWIANSNAAGVTGTSTGVTGGPSSAASFTARMTAPAAVGTYFYKVWAVHGPDDSSGVTNVARYSIDVAAAAPTVLRAHITRLSRARDRARATMTITGRRFATRGVVRFGTAHARIRSWSARQIVVRVPVPRPAAHRARVTVTPRGGRASNGVMFTWKR
jgi:IPT/TIG domain